MINKEPILKTRQVTKKFPGVVALENVDFTLHKGEVHAICGENGAGKSTFCNILTGIYTQDEGEFFFDGEEVNFDHPSQALKAGIRMVYQERNLIPYLTGAQNIFLKEEPMKNGFMVDESKILKLAKELENKYGFNIPLDIPVAKLSSAQKQAIEILRAFLYRPKVLILDEPTSSLTEAEANTLYKVVKKIKSEDVAVIMITHKMEEVFENADVITILRNGKKIVTRKNDDISEDECVKYMVNRNISNIYPEVNYSAEDKIMEVEDLSGFDFINNINMSVKKGEVLGLYGLVGSGRTEFIELLYGLRSIKTGKVKINEQYIKPSVNKMVNNNIFLVPDDRQEKGLFHNLNFKKNLTISLMDKISGFLGLVNSKKENKLANKIVTNDSLQIKYSDINQEVDQLSGGNKQKVVIGRWIVHNKINLLILDDPTIGIDVGTKFEIYKMVRELAEEEGVGIIFISSELPELLGVCDRLYVFKEGNINGELNREDFDNEKILNMAL